MTRLQAKRVNNSKLLALLLLLGLLAKNGLAPAYADDANIQSVFNQKYSHFFGSDSQSLLPFKTMEKSVWQSLQQQKPLVLVYQEPDKFYNSKVYMFSMYHDTQENVYYLDAKGGFWGMDELVYGPITPQELGEGPN